MCLGTAGVGTGADQVHIPIYWSNIQQKVHLRLSKLVFFGNLKTFSHFMLDLVHGVWRKVVFVFEGTFCNSAWVGSL